MSIATRVFMTLNVLLFVANGVILIRTAASPVYAQTDTTRNPERPQLQGTFRLDSPVSNAPRRYELLLLDPADRVQLESDLVNGRLARRRNARIEATWLHPNRQPNGEFRMFYVVSWEQ